MPVTVVPSSVFSRTRSNWQVISKVIGKHHQHPVNEAIAVPLCRAVADTVLRCTPMEANQKNFPAGINKVSHYSDINYVTCSSFPQGLCTLTGPAKLWAGNHLDVCAACVLVDWYPSRTWHTAVWWNAKLSPNNKHAQLKNKTSNIHEAESAQESVCRITTGLDLFFVHTYSRLRNTLIHSNRVLFLFD